MKYYICIGWMVLIVLVQSSHVEGGKRSDDYDDEDEEPIALKDLGTPVKRGAHPNVGVILYDGRQICGCTLVDSSHVLTAASCLSFLKATDIPKMSVYLNTVALKTFNPGAVITKVVRFKLHELYSSQLLGNDIAVVTLDSSITTLYPLSLPVNDRSNDFTGNNATVLRWVPKNEGTLGQKIMSQTTVTIISNAECSTRYGYSMSNGSLCAFTGSETPVTCKDDSNGGPIIVAGQQVGIMSYGKGCMDSYYPGVYTRTTAFIDWIHATISAF